MATYQVIAAERFGGLPPYVRHTSKQGEIWAVFGVNQKTGRSNKTIVAYHEGPNAFRDASRDVKGRDDRAAKRNRETRYTKTKLFLVPGRGKKGGPGTRRYRMVSAYFKDGTRPSWAAKRGTPGQDPVKPKQQTLFNGPKPPAKRAKKAPAAPKAKSPARKAKPKPKAKPKAPKASGYVVETCTTTRRTFASKAEARAAAKKGSVIRDRSSGEYVSKGKKTKAKK